MRRLRVGALLIVACAGIALAPSPSQVQSGTAAGGRALPIGTAVLACPELSVSDDSASTLAGLVVPGGDPGDPEGDPDGATEGATDGATEGAGSAALRILSARSDLARLTAPGDPLTLLVAERSQPPILLEASGAWAPAAVAGVASNELAGAGAGLASAACPAPGPQWWFVGAGSQLGRGAALLVSNPAQEPARFDLTLYARSGPVEALAGRGIDLAPQAHLRLRLDALVAEQDLLAVHVRATSGRVGAALRDVAVPRGDSPRGVDYIPPAVAPTTQLVIGGIPGGAGARDLVLVNPGSQFATVTPRLITAAGPVELPGLASVAVPAGSVISIPLAGQLAQRSASLVLTSDVPITGGLRSSWGTSTRDIAWLSAVPAVRPPNWLGAAAAVPAGKGLVTEVTVVAPESAVAGSLSVSTTGKADESLFSADGPLAAGELAPGPDPARGPEVITSGSTEPQLIRVEVPAGSQQTVVLPATAAGALAHVWWRSDAGSGPAVLSHLTRQEAGPGATGYSWWPTESAVERTPVREDVGTLAPVGSSGSDDTSAGAGQGRSAMSVLESRLPLCAPVVVARSPRARGRPSRR
jgi:hypothetical protein